MTVDRVLTFKGSIVAADPPPLSTQQMIEALDNCRLDEQSEECCRETSSSSSSVLPAVSTSEQNWSNTEMEEEECFSPPSLDW